MREPHPEPKVNSIDEPPTDFERYAVELVAELRRAVSRGDDESAARIRDDLAEHQDTLRELRGEPQYSDDEAMERFLKPTDVSAADLVDGQTQTDDTR